MKTNQKSSRKTSRDTLAAEAAELAAHQAQEQIRHAGGQVPFPCGPEGPFCGLPSCERCQLLGKVSPLVRQVIETPTPAEQRVLKLQASSMYGTVGDKGATAAWPEMTDKRPSEVLAQKQEIVASEGYAPRQPSRKELATSLRKALAAHSRDPKHALSGLTFEVRKAWLDNGPEAVKTPAVDVTVKNPPTKGLESDRATAEADIAHFVKLTAEATGIAVGSIEFGGDHGL